MFADDLITQIKIKNNPTIVGLDPKLEYVPDYITSHSFRKYGNTLRAASDAILEFNKEIIDKIYDIVPAIKPQVAYYEMYGVSGIHTFYETIEYAKSKGLLIIGDCKRNDIDNTAKCYSSAYLGKTQILQSEISAFNTDAITINPYLGSDGINPFIEDCVKYNKGIFILTKTSNKSSSQFQDLLLANGKYFYEELAEYIEDISSKHIGHFGYSSIGAVIGATYPEVAKKLRNILKHSYFLVPGYGQQGGTAANIANCFNSDGLGAVISASRSIMLAYKYMGMDDKKFAEAAREAAINMKNDINKYIL